MDARSAWKRATASIGLVLVAVGFLTGAFLSVRAVDAAWRLDYEGEDAAEYLCQDVPIPNGVESPERTACIDRWLSLGPGGAVVEGLVQAAAWTLGLVVPGAIALLTASGERRPARRRLAARDDSASIS